ncbi:radical SAM protein [uncultured Brachyspira sp.]|uniref:radical SAM protein n=2 Tax=uncultured Brachyspira sp. TaxID=221953 RepID=UPI00260D5E80|nr:radical SAM protein [uncultured Brachyspira sp.]
MKTIKRKSLLYKTKVEYGDYTMNHVLGCAHGCNYPCYAYLLAKRFGNISSYSDWLEPRLVENTIELLDKELPKLHQKINSVHLCFTSDPFMYGYDEIKNMTIEAIKKINSFGIKCTVLTKGILPDELLALSPINEYGITLVSLSEEYREKFEPYSSTYIERIKSLYNLHTNGLKTWVSIEPYPTPNIIEQNIMDILEKISFTNKIIFGRTNYSKLISAYKEHRLFYNQEAKKVIQYCKKNKIDFHIKKGTIS